MHHIENDRSNLVPIILNSQDAIKYRESFIANDNYRDNEEYALYSKLEVKNALADFFDHKCVYCEKKDDTGKFNVDHYRPKRNIKDKNDKDTIGGYYWLCYSWDNLVYTCETCNSNKANYFDIYDENQRITFQQNCLKKIHSLAIEYHTQEEPNFIYPEIDQVTIGDRNSNSTELRVYFEGFTLKSNNKRVNYTIEKCQLKDRLDLISDRQGIVDSINKIIDDIKLSKKNEDDRMQEIAKLLNSIRKDKTNHILFRKYLVKNSKTYIRHFQDAVQP